MREIDLSKYQIRTDLVIDVVNEDNEFEEKENYDFGSVSRIFLDQESSSFLGKKSGDYITINFDDITDSDNYNKILEVVTLELKKILEKTGIAHDFSCLIIGLGNEKSTADLLGVGVSRKVLVTKHIYDISGSLEKGYRITSSFVPGVKGSTGLETSDVIASLFSVSSADFIIVIDALSSSSIDRLLKTIQITNTGINPGSGVGNNRKEISSDVYGVPVIAIGVPTVVDAATIVNDTIGFMKKHFSYNILNKDNLVNKLIPSFKTNYLIDNNYSLSREESNYFLGALGNLSDREKRFLINDVLTPIGYNLMVTPKEIDFVVSKLIDLIASAINNALHDISTKNI